MLSELVCVSQQITRKFAEEHIRSIIQRKRSDSAIDEDELVARASSSVSLRDILRVFDLYKFLMSAPDDVSRVLLPRATSPRSRRRLAVLLSLGGARHDFTPAVLTGSYLENRLDPRMVLLL